MHHHKPHTTTFEIVIITLCTLLFIYYIKICISCIFSFTNKLWKWDNITHKDVHRSCLWPLSLHVVVFFRIYFIVKFELKLFQNICYTIISLIYFNEIMNLQQQKKWYMKKQKILFINMWCAYSKVFIKFLMRLILSLIFVKVLTRRNKGWYIFYSKKKLNAEKILKHPHKSSSNSSRRFCQYRVRVICHKITIHI